jgi:HlyD family secretion protein
MYHFKLKDKLERIPAPCPAGRNGVKVNLQTRDHQVPSSADKGVDETVPPKPQNPLAGRLPDVLIAMTLAVCVVTVFLLNSWQKPATPELAATSSISTVTCLGKLEPNGELVKLSAPTSSQESLISQLNVEEGQRIRRGQVLAILDCEARLKANLQHAKGQLLVAESRLIVTRAGAKRGETEAQKYEIRRLQLDKETRITSQRAVIARLERTYQQAQIDCGRYQVLFKQGAVSNFDYDQRVLLVDTARQNLLEANSVLQQITSTHDAQIESAKATLERIAEVRDVDVDASKAEVIQATAAVSQAQAALEQAYVQSPLTGTVLKIHARAGEKIGDEGFADIGRTDDMIAVAEVYQSDIHKVRLGQKAALNTEAAPDVRLVGTVVRIGQEVRRQSVVNSDPSANIDERVVEVRIRLDGDSSKKVMHLSNAQVTASIQL